MDRFIFATMTLKSMRQPFLRPAFFLLAVALCVFAIDQAANVIFGRQLSRGELVLTAVTLALVGVGASARRRRRFRQREDEMRDSALW